jgi:DNA helicase-2/ATP-dependent DNA helicase PcrA
MSAALAWMRIGLDPAQISRSDLMAAVRRPSRGLTRLAGELFGRRRTVSLHQLEEMRAELDGKQRGRWDSFCADIATVVESMTSDMPEVVRTLVYDIGLDGAAGALDAGRTKADRTAKSDDLVALRRVASLHPDPGGFEPWLRNAVRSAQDDNGVTLTTIHRVKGLEWDRVIVFGADVGLMPHSLADDREEERRVFHVAITRSRVATVVVCDERRPSRFVAEAEGTAPIVDEAPVVPRLPSAGAHGVSVAVGDVISVGG